MNVAKITITVENTVEEKDLPRPRPECQLFHISTCIYTNNLGNKIKGNTACKSNELMSTSCKYRTFNCYRVLTNKSGKKRKGLCKVPEKFRTSL